jgi:hypothetical protein
MEKINSVASRINVVIFSLLWIKVKTITSKIERCGKKIILVKKININ